jgi:glutamyl-tRNA synthetase
MMSSTESNNTRDKILRIIAANAAKYGKPNLKAVMGKVMAEIPEMRDNPKEAIEIVRNLISEFEALSEAEKKRFLEGVEEKKVVKEHHLPPLERAEKGVVMRFAPNPNGPPTLGSARGIIVNSEYVRMYGGKFILRFDDTDPRTKRPMIEAYDWYLEDCEWLDAKPDEVVYASKRISMYYDYLMKLLEMGKAYPCFCSQAEFKKYRDSGQECPHRNTAVEDSLEIWEKMLEGVYQEGEVAVRIKTDMRHKDPAIRDWVAFRIIYASHPVVGDAYHVYPTLDFESAIEDHVLGITHILRGKDLMDSERRQRYIYQYFGWEYPITKLWGKVSIFEFGKLSTSQLRKEVEAGRYRGWDDVRLPTIKAFRRRGFRPEAIRKFFLSLGVSENDVSVSLKNLYAENRKLVDSEANRYFFVADPVKIVIEDLEEVREVKIPLKPGSDVFRTLKGEQEVYITSSDWNRFEKGEIFRLKEFCNVEVVGEGRIGKVRFVSWEMGEVKKGKNIIHWVPVSEAIKCMVEGVDRDCEGYAERNAVSDIGKVVQFERFAFCRIEEMDTVLKCIYTHP